MGLDREDRLFLKEVGKKAVRVLKTRNLRLWNEFKKRCDENGETPESVLGSYLYRFAKSIVDEDGEFAEELLEETIRISALSRRESLLKSLDEIVEVKKKLESAETSKLDRLIEKLIETEIAKAAITPMDMIRQEPEKPEGAIVLDENTLAMLPPEQLELLERVVRKVKEEKVKAMSVSADEIYEMLGEDEEVIESDEEEEEEEDGYSGDSEDGDRSAERVEELSEGA